MSVSELVDQRRGLCVAGRCVEPTVSAEQLAAAISVEQVETFRPLLPVGYDAVAQAYRHTASTISAADLTNHYTGGMDTFRSEFVPWLKNKLADMSGNTWQLDDYVAYASGSDVDMMTHVVEAIAAKQDVFLYPGDWYGFLVGSTHQHHIQWRENATGGLACLCIPSVRNGHLSDEMVGFLDSADACLLNLNLYPTLEESERHTVSKQLSPLLSKSILSISFSRGFGLTASQLGVILIHRDHPLRARYDQQWNWFSYFFNAIATRTLQNLDFDSVRKTDDARRNWVSNWLDGSGLPSVSTGSYYVKSFHVADEKELPCYLSPLVRQGVVRLCFKPPHT